MTGRTKFIRAMGVPRSGNHPIIKFVAENAGPRGFIHFNLSRPFKDPIESALNIETRDGLLRPGRDETLEHLKAKRELDVYDVVIFSYENLFLGEHHGLEHRISEEFEDRIDINLFITRSLPNWMASWMQQRLKKLAKRPELEFSLVNNPFFVAEKVVRVFRNWLEHLREVDKAIAAGGTGQTGSARNVGAVFDSFYNDPSHRQQLLDHMELETKTLDLPGLTPYGGGSSFSGVKVTDATALDVEDRWSHFKSEPYFAHLLQLFWTDAEVRELCTRHFPKSSESIEGFLGRQQPFDLPKAG